MARRAHIREMMMGIEGLALLRNAIDGDEEFLEARVAEMSRLVDPADDLAPPVDSGQLSEIDAARGYAAWASQYDSLPNFIEAVEEPVVEALLTQIPPGSALDAACGTGRHSVTLAKHGHDVIGVDQSPEMLGLAAAKIPAAQFRVGNLTGLPVSDGSIDLVLCALALTHLQDLGPALAEFRRVLRPGGRLIVTDVHPMVVLLFGQPVFAYQPDHLAFVRNHHHPASDYLNAFMANGFAVRSCHEPLYAGPVSPGGHEERIVEAATAAWAGIPSAIIWELQAPA